MAQKSFDYILNVEHRPNKTAVLLAIPMYMYRIETKSLEYGINFFQKAVLMFKTKPGIDNSTISTCLGLDEKLVELVSEQLVTSKLIGTDGRITDRGKEIKNDIDGLIVDDTKKSIGYVFQHLNDEGLYAFYVNNIKKASVLNGEICTGTKGESGDEDFYTSPILAEKLLEERVTNYAPSEREILGLIRRSNKHAHSNTDVETIHIDTKKYGISFVPDNHPSIVWVCTYAYVPRIKDEVYSSEWEIQDPFGFKNNSELKMYVESLIEEGLIDDFRYKFSDLHTVDDQTIDEFQARMDALVNKQMDETFEIGYHKLDRNVQKYLRIVLKNYLILSRTIEIDACGSYVGNIQNALEAIIKLDFEKNDSDYRKVYNSFKYEFRPNGRTRSDFFRPQDRYDYFDELFCSGVLKADLNTEQRIKEFSKEFDPRQAKSLKHYLLKFLFAHKYNNSNPLFDIIKEKVGVIYTIANLRNLSNHGQTSNEKQMRNLSKDEIDLYFSELKQIVNNYIIQYNG